MLLPLLCLIGGTLAALAGVVVFVGGEAISPAVLAVAITLPPAVATFLAVVRVVRRWPLSGPAVVMVGTGFRMVVAVVFVALLRGKAAEFGTTPTALAQWTTGFYLLTLVAETVLLYRLLSGPSEGKANEPPTGIG